MVEREPLAQLSAWQDSVIEAYTGRSVADNPVTLQVMENVKKSIAATTKKRRTPRKISSASIVPSGLFGSGIESVSFQASPATSALTTLALTGGSDMSQSLDNIRDILDRLLPEEALGLEFGGSTASGQRMYNGVWIEDGKVKYQYPNGTVRTLGYTPKAAKAKYRRKSRRKRWTTRDQKEMEWRAHIAAITAGQVSVAPL